MAKNGRREGEGWDRQTTKWGGVIAKKDSRGKKEGGERMDKKE